MTSYRITEHNGTHCLMLGNQLIMQATDLAAIKRVKAGLEDRGHDKRNLVFTDTKETR